MDILQAILFIFILFAIYKFFFSKKENKYKNSKKEREEIIKKKIKKAKNDDGTIDLNKYRR